MASPSHIEKESLEAHVELCAIRYNNLDHKLGDLEHRMDKLDSHLVDIKRSLTSNDKEKNKQQVSLLTGFMSILLAALLGYIGSGLFRGT